MPSVTEHEIPGISPTGIPYSITVIFVHIDPENFFFQWPDRTKMQGIFKILLKEVFEITALGF